MSELSPELKRLAAVSHEAFAPDEQALTALQTALEAQFARSDQNPSADVSDAPLDFAAITRRTLVKWLGGSLLLAAVGGMVWLAASARLASTAAAASAPIRALPHRRTSAPRPTSIARLQLTAATRPMPASTASASS
jgi:hypothetical protein